ncbi:mandelate racemase/muconate lactonizing enzyme family protein [Roseomonas sp. OT10]|uniref:mandelate racemase/muconate lactonizing enzyme family protein n=1 Tax=Roseomonas cutis TaxID=2897332 RepID=UPI001E590415|nr:mandelate racemase/muconate lactonizing enzyme family protein [Roseomonas sp. OT10]UFN50966.1 mandelate racemase/muconate lactonizing enzyme family protein [Roseomonas sp. OT10]
MSDPLTIRAVAAHPLRATLPTVQRTSQGDWPALEIVVVEVTTESGLTGIGECLARRGAAGYARFLRDALAPKLIGRSAHDRRALWNAMRGTLTGRDGGMLVESIAGIDIALWDLAGQAAGQPVWRLLGGEGRGRVMAYASSINWAEEARMEAEIAGALDRGFRQIKLKVGQPVAKAVAHVRRARRQAGEGIGLSVDANWAYDADDALRVGKALAEEDYLWFEEPVRPDDHAGYRRLARHLPVRLAAGESDFVARQSADLVAEHVLGLVQPDVARSGGITETWRIAEHAALHGVAYAPHVGWSGGICAAASLHLAAAAESFLTFECMVFDNPLRQALTAPLAGDVSRLEGGMLAVPDRPGLGVTLDPEALARHAIAE